MLTRKIRCLSLVYIATFLGTVIAAFGGICFIPDDPYIRFQSLKGTIVEHVAWDYERIHFDSTPIDIAILGNSRAKTAVNSPLLEELLSRQGERVHTVNFAIPGNGLDIQYALAKRLFQEKSPRVILISLADQLPRDGHQAFADIADPIDVIRSPLLINRFYARNLVYLSMRQLRGIYSWAFSDALGFVRQWNSEAYLGSNVDTREDSKATDSRSDAEQQEMVNESKRRKSSIARPRLPNSLHSIEFGVSEFYVNKIVELAASKNTKVFFLYVPIYQGFDKPFDEKWLLTRGEIFEASYLKTDSENYMDCGHASETGSQLVTKWLAERLGEILLAPSEK